MLWVKFESIYTETDEYGRIKRWENRFETMGTAPEINNFLEEATKRLELPGTKNLLISDQLKKYLLED